MASPAIRPSAHRRFPGTARGFPRSARRAWGPSDAQARLVSLAGGWRCRRRRGLDAGVGEHALDAGRGDQDARLAGHPRTARTSPAVRKTPSAPASRCHGSSSSPRGSSRSPSVTIVRSPVSSTIVNTVRLGPCRSGACSSTWLDPRSGRTSPATRSSPSAERKRHARADLASWTAATAPPPPAPSQVSVACSISTALGPGGRARTDPFDVADHCQPHSRDRSSRTVTGQLNGKLCIVDGVPDSFGKRQRESGKAKKAAAREERRLARAQRDADREAGLIEGRDAVRGVRAGRARAGERARAASEARRDRHGRQVLTPDTTKGRPRGLPFAVFRGPVSRDGRPRLAGLSGPALPRRSPSAPRRGSGNPHPRSR